ncbi:hypothetical protein O9G_003709 [Rozella allomycis CSF55]|uniref:Uncharacterized protein n=1 Tax=Rozella allomycis (strain CSF55) TaxID=988480 RepID=A0A075ARW5_ROZAC|nr:hypothetical protein O9G_003709 [Rozella allomycis CSF55]|eukprot:EPZ32978.1 hypothetical protein O9G_003709 [Rozella allomycis CSF55]
MTKRDYQEYICDVTSIDNVQKKLRTINLEVPVRPLQLGFLLPDNSRILTKVFNTHTKAVDLYFWMSKDILNKDPSEFEIKWYPLNSLPATNDKLIDIGVKIRF